jgi:dynein heavy chain, axonemal
MNVMVPAHNLYDLKYDFMEKNWNQWERKISDEPLRPFSEVPFSKILVQTVDTVRFSYLLAELNKKEFPVLFVGEPGTSKTVIVNNYLAGLDLDKNAILGVNFSSRTSSMEV